MKYLKLFEGVKYDNEYLDKVLSNYKLLLTEYSFKNMELFFDISQKTLVLMRGAIERESSMKTLSRIFVKRAISKLTKKELLILSTWDKFYSEYERFNTKVKEVHNFESYIMDSDDSDFQIYISGEHHKQLYINPEIALDIIQDIKDFELDSESMFKLEFNNGYITIKINYEDR